MGVGRRASRRRRWSVRQSGISLSRRRTINPREQPSATAPNSSRTPSGDQTHDELGTRLANLDKLSHADRPALLHILDGLLANARIRAALTCQAS